MCLKVTNYHRSNPSTSGNYLSARYNCSSQLCDKFFALYKRTGLLSHYDKFKYFRRKASRIANEDKKRYL